MTHNPYQPPSILPDDSPREQRPRRPVGIAILALLHAVGALLIAALGVFLAMQFDESDANSIIAWIVIVAAPVLTVLSLATTIGLWLGRKWAWWLATFYYFQFVVGGLCVLTTIAVACFVLDRPWTERTEELLVKHVGRLAIFSMLTWFMMRRSVFRFFDFQRLTRLRALCILTGIVLLFVTLTALLVAAALLMGATLE